MSGMQVNQALVNQIFQKLDADDGKKDGHINYTIWNDFANNLANGNEIKREIGKENAIKSITTYIMREAQRIGKSANEVAKAWLNGEVTMSKEEEAEMEKVKASVSFEAPDPKQMQEEWDAIMAEQRAAEEEENRRLEVEGEILKAKELIKEQSPQEEERPTPIPRDNG